MQLHYHIPSTKITRETRIEAFSSTVTTCLCFSIVVKLRYTMTNNQHELTSSIFPLHLTARQQCLL